MEPTPEGLVHRLGRSDAPPDQQIEDNLAQTTSVDRLKADKMKSHRFRSRRTNHGRLDHDRFFFRRRFDDEFKQAAERQHRGAFERTAVHRDFRRATFHASAIVGKKRSLKGCGQPNVFSAIDRLFAGGRDRPMGTETSGAQLTAERKDVETIEELLDGPRAVGRSDERGPATGTVQIGYELVSGPRRMRQREERSSAVRHVRCASKIGSMRAGE